MKNLPMRRDRRDTLRWHDLKVAITSDNVMESIGVTITTEEDQVDFWLEPHELNELCFLLTSHTIKYEDMTDVSE